MQLGSKTDLPSSPDEAVIETVINPSSWSYVARFTAPEFTSLCPVTGQPDFAKLVIDYFPRTKLIESKSLKLFLGAFRNHRAFHEACTLEIAHRLINAANPVWFRIAAYWYPRGGIPIDVFFQTGEPPRGLLIPDLPKMDFQGR